MEAKNNRKSCVQMAEVRLQPSDREKWAVLNVYHHPNQIKPWVFKHNMEICEKDQGDKLQVIEHKNKTWIEERTRGKREVSYASRGILDIIFF